MSDNDDIKMAMAAIGADEDQARAHTEALAKRVGLFRKTLLIEGFQQEKADQMAHQLFITIIQVNAEIAVGETDTEGDDDDEYQE